MFPVKSQQLGKVCITLWLAAFFQGVCLPFAGMLYSDLAGDAFFVMSALPDVL